MKTKKIKIKRNPERHKLLLKQISDNIGNGMTFEEAMLSVGYSESYAKSSHIKTTESWQDLLNTSLSDDILLKRHHELLNKEEVILRNNNKTNKIEIIKTGQPHSDVKAALDMSYKLKDKYTAEKHTHKFQEYTKDQLIEFIMSKFVKKQ